MKARGLCDMHYKRMLKNGDPLIVARRGPKTNIFCYECGKPAKVKGYCRYHYRKMWANSRIKSFENDR